MKDKRTSLRKILFGMTIAASIILFVLLLFYCLAPIPVFRLS